MSDPISGIKHIGPTYPVRPAQPAQKDREPGKRKKKRQEKSGPDESDNDHKTTIDEHV